MASPHCVFSYELQDKIFEQKIYHTDHIQKAFPHCVLPGVLKGYLYPQMFYHTEHI